MPATTVRRPALLEQLYEPIAGDLAEVERLLQAELQSDDPFVDELVRYGSWLGGKRLRPALLLLAARAVGVRPKREHITLAAVVEMIHTATLIHDDVLDEARMRRHLATVNARWDNEASVLLGDFLFTHAFYLASTLGDVTACRLIGRATNIVCEGELRQKGSRGNFQLTEHEYLQIIEAKTAELTAVSCRLGGCYAGAKDDVVDGLDRFGRNLGIAFQIADDLLDYAGEEQTTGKSLGTDFEKHKPTLPIIRALQLASPDDRKALHKLLVAAEQQPAARVLPYLERYEALGYARARAQQFAVQARRSLDCVPPSSAREVLAAMTRFAVERSV